MAFYQITGLSILAAVLLSSCGWQSTAKTEQRTSTKSYQRFVPISGSPTALDTKTGQQCVTSKHYAGEVDLPECIVLFTAYPD
jgi:hypothetical protein